MRTRGLLVLLFFVSQFVYAQDNLSVGFAAGGVFSKPVISDDPLPITNSMTTFASAGAVVRVPLEGRLFIQSEPSVLRKGGKWSESYFGYTFAFQARADYLEIPVMIGLSVDLGPLSPYFLIGPSVAYKLSETWDLGFNSGSSPYFYTRYDVSLHGGAGVLYRVASPVSVLVEARYALGLNQVNAQGSGQLHSSDFRLSAGLMFSL
jgi:opacity protein-like surface antigen